MKRFGLGRDIENLVVCSVEAARSIKKSVVVVRRGLKSVVKEWRPAARPSVTVQRRREACEREGGTSEEISHEGACRIYTPQKCSSAKANERIARRMVQWAARAYRLPVRTARNWVAHCPHVVPATPVANISIGYRTRDTAHTCPTFRDIDRTYNKLLLLLCLVSATL